MRFLRSFFALLFLVVAFVVASPAPSLTEFNRQHVNEVNNHVLGTGGQAQKFGLNNAQTLPSGHSVHKVAGDGGAENWIVSGGHINGHQRGLLSIEHSVANTGGAITQGRLNQPGYMKKTKSPSTANHEGSRTNSDGSKTPVNIHYPLTQTPGLKRVTNKVILANSVLTAVNRKNEPSPTGNSIRVTRRFEGDDDDDDEGYESVKEDMDFDADDADYLELALEFDSLDQSADLDDLF